MKNIHKKVAPILAASAIFFVALGFSINVESKETDIYQNYSNKEIDLNKTAIDNKFNVTLPKGFNLSDNYTIYDGSARYYLKAEYDRESFDCSTEERGCVLFNPTKTYLECQVAYGSAESGEDFMQDNCVLSNKTKPVTLRTDDRNNDITAPLTDQEYEVIKSRSFGKDIQRPTVGSDFLNRDAYFVNPWDLAHLEEDRYLVTGIPGEVNDVKNGKNVKYEIEVLEEGPMDSPLDDDPYTGLLGAVPHPNFSQNSIVYLNYAYEVAQGNTTHTKVSKFRLDRDEQEIEKLDTIIKGIPGRLYYHGGRMRFGPEERFLYITTGAADYSRVQNNSYLGGKLLRLYPNGSIPQSNPYGNEVYASGLRNPQGLAFNPETGDPYISQHGPWRRDVIAEVDKGSNLGWPENCKRSYPEAEKGEEILCPQTWTLAPSGITFVDDKDHKWYGDLFIAGLRSRQIHRIDMDGEKALKNEIFWFNGMNSDPYPNYYNRLRDVEFIDGDLWVLHNKGAITKLSTKHSTPVWEIING